MNSSESLRNIVTSVNSGKKYPALQLVKANPEAAAIISKLSRPKDPNEVNLHDKRSYYQLNQSQIQAISETIKTRINDNKNIIQLFPDIELAIQILISSILSPKDMVSTQLIYKTSRSLLPSELSLKLLGIIEEHLENHYKLKSDLQTILRDTLFDTGSHVKIVIPESILDDVINRNVQLSTEALGEIFEPTSRADKEKIVSLGILGNPTFNDRRSALENFTASLRTEHYVGQIKSEDEAINKALESLVDVTDNYKLLKLPKVIEVSNQNKIKSIVKRRVSKENRNRLTDNQLENLLYKDNPLKSDEFVVVPGRLNARRKSVGRPLVMNLPSESVIPVHVPGDETAHVGYFVLIDIDGNPVTLAQNYTYMNGLEQSLNQNQQTQSLSSLLITKAKKNLVNSDSVPTLDHITKVYTNILEKDLIQRLRNGLYKTSVSISNNNEIYRVMLARALSNQFTRLVFIPAELTTYFAFKYFDNGVGKSYLDNLKVLCSLRAILLFSRVMAMTKNSIAVTHVNMTLDPRDPDPQKTIEIATHDIVKMRQQYFPLGINSPVDLVDWIQRAGFEFSFEGHPGLPQTKFDFETKNLQHAIPDDTLDENLRKQTYMSLGLSPETVDNGYTSEFATTVVANNILLSKRVIQIQEIFCADLSEFSRKLISNDVVIFDELKQALLENKALVEKMLTDEEKTFYQTNEESFLEDLLESFIETLELDLPKPDITSVETQTAAFDQYVESLDKTLDAWISTEFMTGDIIGDVSSNMDSIKAILRSYFIRQWMAENGFMSELNDIVTSDEDGKPNIDIYDINKNHMEGLVKTTMRFIQSLQGIKDAANKDIENLGVEPGDTTSSDTSSGGSSDEFGGMDEFGDMGDMGDLDGTEEETPPEDEAEPATPEEKPEGEEEPKPEV